jgi:hypothetical protein
MDARLQQLPEVKFDASFAQFVLWQLQARKTLGKLLSVLDSPSGG